MKTLLHTCCAPCSIYCVDSLRQEGIEPVSYWFNPNIHPYTEYRSRKTTLEEYAKSIQLPLVIDNTYGLRSFVKAVIDDLDNRCFYCYRVRLEQTALYAAEHHFDCFSTTLLVSPYQKHEALIAAGEAPPKNTAWPFSIGTSAWASQEGQTKAPGAGPLYAKILRLHFQRRGTVPRQTAKKRAGTAPAAKHRPGLIPLWYAAPSAKVKG